MPGRLAFIFLASPIRPQYPQNLRKASQDATFLFGQEIPVYLKRLDVQALNLMAINDELRDLPVGDERSRLCSKGSELLEALTGELPNLKSVFAQYLRFDRWK